MTDLRQGDQAILVLLVIEDEPSDALLIKRQLLAGDPGAFVVHLANSLAAARALIDTKGLRPDVVLLDLNLPDSTGIATVERCRALCNAPVVVLTGLDDKSAIQAAIQSGAEDYLSKSAGDGVALRKAIRYAMLRHQRDSAARLTASVFTHSREAILIADADGTVIDVNDAFSRITGYSRDEVVGHTPHILSSGRHEQSFFAALWRDLIERGYWHGEVWNRRKNGEVFATLQTISAVHDGGGRTQHYVSLFTDITERKAMEDQIRQMAFHDQLTQLPNRRLFIDRLSQAMAASKRSARYGAAMFLDLDNFKPLNDRHGHDAGDLLLIEAAERLKSCVREMDTVARFGGDEFVVLISELDVDKAESITQAGVIAEKIRLALAAPYRLIVQHAGKSGSTVEHHCSASIGVVLFRDHEASQHEIFKWADAAMYQAKKAGRNTIRFHDESTKRKRPHRP